MLSCLVNCSNHPRTSLLHSPPLSAPLLCSFLHSFAVRGNSSLFFSIPSALFTKTPGVYPRDQSENIVPTGRRPQVTDH